MKYGIQMQTALDRLDQSLARLHTMVKRGETANAVEYMERGELKDRFEELQNKSPILTYLAFILI